MTIELTMLVLSALLCLLLVFPASFGMMAQRGVGAAMGNREGMPPLTGWPGRADRAHANLMQNLLPFTALVLAAHAAGKLGTLTVIGTQLFFYARVAHAAIYIAGIIYLRTLAHALSVVGMVLVAVAFFA